MAQKRVDLCSPCGRCCDIGNSFLQSIAGGACCAIAHCAGCCSVLCLFGMYGVWSMIAYGNAMRHFPTVHVHMPTMVYINATASLKVDLDIDVHNSLSWPFVATVDQLDLEVYSEDIRTWSTARIPLGAATAIDKQVQPHGNATFSFPKAADKKLVTEGPREQTDLKARMERDCGSGATVTRLVVKVMPQYDLRFGIKIYPEAGPQDSTQEFSFDVFCAGAAAQPVPDLSVAAAPPVLDLSGAPAQPVLDLSASHDRSTSASTVDELGGRETFASAADDSRRPETSVSAADELSRPGDVLV